MVDEPEVAAAVAVRRHRFVMPLQHPVGVGEAAGLLGVRRGREEEDLGSDVRGCQLAGLDLRAVLPPRRRLDQVEVADHEPVQLGHPQALHPRVGRADGRVLPKEEVAHAPAVHLVHDGLVGGVVAGDPREVVEPVVVLGGGRGTPVGLEQAHRVGPHVRPEAGVGPVGPDEVVERLVLVCVRHRDVAGQQVEQGRDIAKNPECSRARGAPGSRRPAARCCPAAAAGSTPPG